MAQQKRPTKPNRYWLQREEGRIYIPKKPRSIKPRIQAHPRSCISKHRDPDELTARARAATRLAEPDCEIVKLWCYRCKDCAGWHLTRKPNKSPPITRDNTLEKT
jgi:hypothetical protein